MINEYFHSLSVVDKSLRDLHRTQRLEKNNPKEKLEKPYKLPTALDIVSRARFGFQKGDVICIRTKGLGSFTGVFVVMHSLSDGYRVHSLRWDNHSTNWLETRNILFSEVLLFVGHSFNEKDAKS